MTFTREQKIKILRLAIGYLQSGQCRCMCSAIVGGAQKIVPQAFISLCSEIRLHHFKIFKQDWKSKSVPREYGPKYAYWYPCYDQFKPRRLWHLRTAIKRLQK